MPRKHTPAKHARTPLPNSSDCGNKRRYPTEKQAQYAAETQMLTSMQLQLGVYQCGTCRKWHLTSNNKS